MSKKWEVVRNVGWGDVAIRGSLDDVGVGLGGVRGGLVDGRVPTWRRPNHPDANGRIVVLRGQVAGMPSPGVTRVDINVAPVPREPSNIPWAAVLSSLAAGLVVATIFSPLFAILAAVSAVGLIARSVASRWSHRRALRRRDADLASAAVDIQAGADGWVGAEELRRRATVEGPDDARCALASGTYPWQQLDATELRITFGRGAQQCVPQLDLGTDDAAVAALVPESVTLHDVPIAVAASGGAGLAIVGDRGSSLSLARWVLLDQATRHGPASLPIRLVTTADRLADWDWAKWLPSLAGVAIGGDEAQRMLAGLPDVEPGGLLVIDGVEPATAGELPKILSATDTAHKVVWIGSMAHVPAACSSVVEATADGAARVMNGADVSSTTSAWSVSLDDAIDWARGLAPFVDPLVSDGLTAIPERVGIDELSRGHFEEMWAAATPDRLPVGLGIGASGAVSIDLVADGPHALVAGTTGSGKSEFLRTLVAGLALRQPPELLSFVLVDFKGGGAFDHVSGLPHVAAVVTDLDAETAGRALTSMRAELKGREETLRRLGVSDVSDLDRAAAEEIPRLVLVVDEFATLAEELPEFLDGLVDIARRGRSLGVHLVLATQRPAGVITGQIRANTNIRLCLRVQDRNDSIDVIDQPDAALLPAIAGRALLAVGANTPIPLQIASVSMPADGEGLEPFVLHPEVLRADRVMAAAYANTLAELNGCTQREGERQANPREFSIERLAESMRLATSTRARAPWLPPVADVQIDDVVGLLADGSSEIPLGLLDDPEHRRHDPLAWQSVQDGLLVLGGSRSSVEHTVRLAVVGLLEQRRAVYIFDGLGGLEDLGDLLGVGDVITSRNAEQAVRAVGFLARSLRSESEPPAIVVRGWASVADCLESGGGADARMDLERLVREGLAAGAPIVVTGASDRDVPGRIRSRLGCRILHQLADPSSFAMFGLRRVPNLSDPLSCVDPLSGRVGAVAGLSESRLDGVRALRPASGTPVAIHILGGFVSLAALPDVVSEGNRHLVAVGLDENLETYAIDVRPDRPVVVLGEPGSERSAFVARLEACLAEAAPVVVDAAERVNKDDGVALVAQARADHRPLVIAASPQAARGFDSWIGKSLTDATVLFVNPTSRDGEVCRVVVPDLRDAPAGRSAIVDRGRVTVVQLAA